jgi:hypothetical protein
MSSQVTPEGQYLTVNPPVLETPHTTSMTPLPHTTSAYLRLRSPMGPALVRYRGGEELCLPDNQCA